MENSFFILLTILVLILIAQIIFMLIYNKSTKKIENSIIDSLNDFKIVSSKNSKEVINSIELNNSTLNKLSEFMKLYLEDYNKTVYLNIKDLNDNIENSKKIFIQTLNELTKDNDNHLKTLNSITEKSIVDIGKIIVSSNDSIKQSILNEQMEIGRIMKDGLEKIDNSLRETINVD